MSTRWSGSTPRSPAYFFVYSFDSVWVSTRVHIVSDAYHRNSNKYSFLGLRVSDLRSSISLAEAISRTVPSW